MEENLQNEEPKEEFTEPVDTCDGKSRPDDPKGQVGEWVCTPNGWSWSPFIGG